MPTYTVSEKDYTKLLRQHARAREGAVRSALNEAAALGAEVVAHKVPVDQGTLKASIRAVPGSVPEIVADAPHAATIENGARPHWPPLAPLEEWVQRHAAEMGLEEGQIKGVAFLIARKISEVGSEPHWFMRGSQEALKAILKEIVERRLSGSP